MQCIVSQRNNQIKLTHYDDTKKKTHDSQIVRAKENLKLSYGGPSQRQASGNANITQNNCRIPRSLKSCQDKFRVPRPGPYICQCMLSIQLRFSNRTPTHWFISRSIWFYLQIHTRVDYYKYSFYPRNRAKSH